MDFVDVNGLRVAYESAGSGPPVVLVHGFVGDGASTWWGQLSDLSDQFALVALDLPGAGQSDDPPDWFRISEYGDCLAGFVRALGLDGAHLVGLSLGGAIVLEVVRQRPELARSISLVSAYAGWAGSLDPQALQERLARSLQAADLPPQEFADAMLASMFSESAAPKRVARFGASVRAFHRSGFLAMTLASAEADLREVLPTVRVPTLLVYGERDVRAPVSVGRAIHAAIPDSRLVVLPDVGHAIPVEAPDQLNRELRAFLATCA
jgi:pimeloyl-ACP methyl ester carboxylesterase